MKMNISIRSKIYCSFFLFVSLFVVNGVITIINLHETKELSENISTVVDPSIQALNDLNKMLIESKMYTTNWVYLRSNQADKNSLVNIHDKEYAMLRIRLLKLSATWDKNLSDSLNSVLSNFEQLVTEEKNITGTLKNFDDYDDPVIRLEAEQILEDQVLPRTSNTALLLGGITRRQMAIRLKENERLEASAGRLRIFIIVLALTIICIGIFFSLYMTKTIIGPINRIRLLLNDLGRGMLMKAEHATVSDEMGKMVVSVNQLSEKLQATAKFAQEIGKRNFDIPFQPLSGDDILGKSLIAMRDKLKSGDERLNEAQHIAKLGSWEWDIATEKLFWSDEMYNIFEVSSRNFVHSYDRFLDFIIPEDRTNVNSSFANCLMTHDPFSYECRVITGNNISKILFTQGRVSLNEKGDVEKMYGITQDITLRKKAEESLEINNKELQVKNKELEQFAFVASHDLQEPLRTTASYVQLLKSRYQGKLDSNADKYLDYIVHASDRMKVLITDLLDYSRIGKENEFIKSDCKLIMNDVLADIDLAIKEAGAEITISELPKMSCNPKEIKQLFQNLVLNAIKFRKKDSVPRIKINAKKEKGYWHFSFEDNGIGIDEQHKDRIFIIFQRLHTRSEYNGSGIGLSHCKKIVELHRGRIWVISAPGQGSTFHFTIQENNSIINQKPTYETKTELHHAH